MTVRDYMYYTYDGTEYILYVTPLVYFTYAAQYTASHRIAAHSTP